jgi:hypothetical protein
MSIKSTTGTAATSRIWKRAMLGRLKQPRASKRGSRMRSLCFHRHCIVPKAQRNLCLASARMLSGASVHLAHSLPAIPMQGQRQVSVFCDSIRIEAAGFLDCLSAKCADRSRDDGDRIDAIVGATVEVEAVDVLEALEARNPCLQVADPCVSGYGANARISERLNQKRQRVGLKLCIGVRKTMTSLAAAARPRVRAPDFPLLACRNTRRRGSPTSAARAAVASFEPSSTTMTFSDPD